MRVRIVRARSIVRRVALAIALHAVLTAWGHGDLHLQIERVTEQIRHNPKDVDLYLRRARLSHLHEDWAAAASDFDQAEVLAPTLDAIHLGRGQMLLSASRIPEARAELDKFLAQKPQHVVGLITRARIEVRRGQPRAAAADFLQALDLAPQPEPELYVECAQSLAAVDESRMVEAVSILDRGIAKLGNLPSLELPALDIEIKLGHWDAALARIQCLGAKSPRPETWLARRGDILAQAGRSEESRASYRAAVDAIAKLPAHIRSRPATADLSATLHRKLAEESPNPAR